MSQQIRETIEYTPLNRDSSDEEGSTEYEEPEEPTPRPRRECQSGVPDPDYEPEHVREPARRRRRPRRLFDEEPTVDATNELVVEEELEQVPPAKRKRDQRNANKAEGIFDVIAVDSKDGKPSDPPGVLAKWRNRCGKVIKDKCSITYTDWRLVPTHLKEEMWKAVKEKIKFRRQDEEKGRKATMDCLCRCFRDFKCMLNREYIKQDRVPSKYGNITAYEWNIFRAQKTSVDALELSARMLELNKRNKYHPHLGPGGYRAKVDEWRELERKNREEGKPDPLRFLDERTRNWIYARAEKIPPGFIRVSVDEIVEGYEDNEIEIPIPEEGIETLKDTLGTFIMWKRREVVLLTRTSPAPLSGHGSHHASQPSRADGQPSPTSAAASASNARSAGKEAIMVAERNEWSLTIENLGDAAATPIREKPGSNDVPNDEPHQPNDEPQSKDDALSQPLPSKDDARPQPPPSKDDARPQPPPSKDDALSHPPPSKDVARPEPPPSKDNVLSKDAPSKDDALPQPPPKKDVRPPPSTKPYVPVIPRTVTGFDTEPTGRKKEVQEAVKSYMESWKNTWNPTCQAAPKVDHVKDPRSLLCYDDEVLGDLTDEDVTTFELGKQLVPKICLKNMPWEMKKLHHWYMQAAKGVSMIPLKYGSDIFNDMEPMKTNIMGITFDEIYRAFRLQRMDSTLVTLWCIDHWICLCLIPTNGYLLVLDSLDVEKKRYQDIISVIDCTYANYCKAGGKHSPYRDKYMYFRHKFWCYKQPRGSVHCGYYTCIFSQSSSKYLYTITEETKEEKEQRMKRQKTQRQKEYEMIRRGIIPPDSIHLTTNVMYRVVANLCRFILREIIHPNGKFFDPESDLAMNHWSLYEWTGSKRPYEPNLDPMENDDYEVLEKEER
ncbi:hypothetical protein EJB05_49493, partial [Eragrostis curvula]